VVEGYGARSLQTRLLGLLDERTARAGGNGYETNCFFKVWLVGKRGLLLRRQDRWTHAKQGSRAHCSIGDNTPSHMSNLGQICIAWYFTGVKHIKV
jgi:hypothetical protein